MFANIDYPTQLPSADIKIPLDPPFSKGEIHGSKTRFPPFTKGGRGDFRGTAKGNGTDTTNSERVQGRSSKKRIPSEV